MTRFSALLLALCFSATGCLLSESGRCDFGANPKEHACRAPVEEPPTVSDDASITAPDAESRPGCAPALGYATSGVVATGTSLSRGSCGGSGAESWYVFTARESANYTFETTDADFDTVLYVLRGECGGAEIACDDDGGSGTSSQVSVDLVRSERVTVVVDAYATSGGGDYRLRVTFR